MRFITAMERSSAAERSTLPFSFIFSIRARRPLISFEAGVISDKEDNDNAQENHRRANPEFHFLCLRFAPGVHLLKKFLVRRDKQNDNEREDEQKVVEDKIAESGCVGCAVVEESQNHEIRATGAREFTERDQTPDQKHRRQRKDRKSVV